MRHLMRLRDLEGWWVPAFQHTVFHKARLVGRTFQNKYHSGATLEHGAKERSRATGGLDRALERPLSRLEPSSTDHEERWRDGMRMGWRITRRAHSPLLARFTGWAWRVGSLGSRELVSAEPLECNTSILYLLRVLLSERRALVASLSTLASSHPETKRAAQAIRQSIRGTCTPRDQSADTGGGKNELRANTVVLRLKFLDGTSQAEMRSTWRLGTALSVRDKKGLRR